MKAVTIAAAVLYGLTIPSQASPVTKTAGDVIILYSNLCVNAETGDILGTRIALINFAGDKYAFYQIAQGGLQNPQVASVSDEKLKRSQLEFRVVGWNGKPEMVRGTIAKGELTLISGERLKKRSPSYLFGACR